VVLQNDRHPPARPGAPAPTIGAKDRGQGTVLRVEDPNRPPHDPDKPIRTITAAGRGHQNLISARVSQAMRIGAVDKPGDTITAAPARVGTGSGHVVEWPWNRPATTVHADPRTPPPGHHEAEYSIMSHPNAIVLSERAVAILQGFPETWVFAGETKRARWSQIGQAMPPGLAQAVAESIVAQMAAADDEGKGAA